LKRDETLAAGIETNRHVLGSRDPGRYDLSTGNKLSEVQLMLVLFSYII